MTVSKVIEWAVISETIVVGEETDLLVLLLYHADLSRHKIFFKPEMKQNVRSETVLRDILSINEALGVIIYFLYMQLLDVIPHRVYLELENDHH